MNFSSFTEVGGHAQNEDAFAVRTHPGEESCTICFVADGQGGQPGGGPAAQLACRVGLAIASAIPPQRLMDRRVWTDLLRKVDDAVRLDANAGFTTFIGLCALGNRVVGVSSGDSAALLVSENQACELTRGQCKNPPVGSGSAVPVSFEMAAVAPWRLLAITDGVWKYVGWEHLIAVAQREQGAALLSKLQRAARLPGSGKFQDDFTIVLLERVRDLDADFGSNESLTPERVSI